MADPSILRPTLLPSLQRLDRLLELAVSKVPAIFGADLATDRFRGLYVSRSDVALLLSRPPGEPLFADTLTRVDAGPPEARLGWLARAMDLSAFDLDVVLLALAPELDGRYERVYAYLQDDVTRRRPTVELALNLLCEDAADRLARRWHFSPDGPLSSARVIELIAEPNASAPTLLSHSLRLDPQIVNLLLEQDVLDSRLVDSCQLVTQRADQPCALTDRDMRSLTARAERARREQEPLRLEFVGARGTGKRGVASALASALDLELLLVDAKRLAASAIDGEQVLALVVRAAWFRDALLYVRNAEALIDDARLPLERLTAALSDYPGLAIIASTSQLPVDTSLRGALRWSFGVPQAEVRERLWTAALERHDVTLEAGVSRALADRFRLIPADIEGAAALARARSTLNEDGSVSAADLFNAAREQRGAELEQLAVRSRPTRSWHELVLPSDQQAQLRELCERAAEHRFVLDEWDFASKLPRGRGINALFAGPSGTGKTMAAEVIASALGVDLWRIDLASVVSKYIGETEKNLDRIFTAAESANGVLLFDEAEALFGKRSEVRDSHDRYANIEVAYLLQKMEQFDGIAILATNLRGNLDEAFVRRLAFSVHFPVPDESSRRRIWQGIFPSPLPLAGDVDFDQLARDVQLTGGHIHNIALAAAYLAAADGRVVTMSHLLDATRREYQKLGKHVPAAALAVTAT